MPPKQDGHVGRALGLRRWVLWPGLGVLAVLGIVAAVARGVAVATGGSTFAWIRSSLPLWMISDTDIVEAWFADAAWLTLVHVTAGCVFLALAPFQFSTGIRQRYPRIHRITGRIALIAAIPTVASGLLFAALSPFGGVAADAAIYLFGTIFVVALWRAYAAIRRGDITTHREWMLRLISIGAGIATVRVVSIPLLVLTGRPPLELLAASFWIGLGVTYVAAELWIRWTRIPALRAVVVTG
jgi:uncharacterized membrane protein